MNSDKIFGDDRGVSPVIGVILMVAITVILAAVIGTFVLGLGENIGSSATAGVSVSGDTATLSNIGTADSVVIEDDNGNVGNMTSVGDTVDIGSATGTVRIIAVADGERTLLRTID